MATSIPKHRNRYRVAEAKQQMVDKIGTDKIELELESGEVVSFPHPMFYSSALKRELKALDDDDSEGIALALMGQEQFDKFIESGEDPDDLGFVVNQAREEAMDILAGRKRPTQS